MALIVTRLVVKVLLGCSAVIVAGNLSASSDETSVEREGVIIGNCPGVPKLTAPANGAVGVAQLPTLSWVPGSSAQSHDVYFGTSSAPVLVTNTTANTYNPPALAAGTTYYWKIAARRSTCDKSSPIWSFKTVGGPSLEVPTAPLPANGASKVSNTTVLQWQAVTAATSYDVFFGTTVKPPQVGNVTLNSFTPGVLQAKKRYYWRVVAKSSDGTKTSATWSFTTDSAPVGSDWYVNQATGSDSNTGRTQDKPFKTIQKAADVAVSGNTILVYTGTYREWVHPKASGVTYSCVPGNKCVIKGSEIFTDWIPTSDPKVYKKTIPHSYFQVPGGIGGIPYGNYNPYASDRVMDANWNQIGKWVSRGQVYWDDDGVGDDALRETQTQAEMKSTERTWWIERGPTNTSDVTIWAHFPADPTGHTVELNVRLACFDPSYWVGGNTRSTQGIQAGPRINSLTVEGFDMRHAAPDWAEIGGYQRGLISTNWGHSWKIRYNHFSDSKAVCVTSGSIGLSFGATWDNGAGMDGPPFNKFGVGNHEISHNIIERCGAGGIHGNRGLAASLIEYNLVQDINYQRLMGGLGFAGIHPMTAIDTVIKNNIIRRVYRTPSQLLQWEAGIWVEFSGQGVRSTGNIIYDIEGILHHFEANHGPMLADNNIFWNSFNVDQTLPHFVGMKTSSYQSIFANNMIVNSAWDPYKTTHTGGSGPRTWTPHTSRRDPLGIAANPEEGWYVNNIMVEKGSTTIKNNAGTRLDWNVYWKGATKADWEGPHSMVQSSFDPHFQIAETFDDGVTVSFCADTSPGLVAAPRISGSPSLAGTGGLIPIHPYLPRPSQTIETHTADKITIDTDILGRQRNSTTVMAGPLATLVTGGEPCTSRNVIVLRAQH